MALLCLYILGERGNWGPMCRGREEHIPNFSQVASALKIPPINHYSPTKRTSLAYIQKAVGQKGRHLD